MWKILNDKNVDWVADFVMIQWHIWFRRNKFIHKGKRTRPEVLFRNALELRQEYSIAKPNSTTVAAPHIAPPQQWQAPC